MRKNQRANKRLGFTADTPAQLEEHREETKRLTLEEILAHNQSMEKRLKVSRRSRKGCVCKGRN